MAGEMERMKRLTSTSFWNKNYDKKTRNVRYANSRFSSMSFYFYDLYKNIKPFVKQNGKIMEIGCAPGNVLIELSKKLKLQPYGIEYTKSGSDMTKKNFEKNGFDKKRVIYSDFFSEKFQNEHKDKYDVVCSFGFIEHFEDTKKTIELHSNLLKKKGTLVIVIPNFAYGNKLLLKKDLLDKHNLSIMSPELLKKHIPKNLKIEKIDYFGGPFNIGLYRCKNKIFETARFCMFLFQRIFLDPLFFVLKKIGINLKNKYFSPSIIMICTKK